MVCVIPTGSLEQHGPHLPLFTDTLLASGVAALAEKQRPDITLLYPAVWLGCSGHHMAMDGTATASSGTYMSVLSEIIESAIAHGFEKFLVLNGHGGNTEQNGVALRELKAGYPTHVFAHAGYYQLIGNEGEKLLKGPLKSIRHSCEAEVSMMMHLHPELVRKEKLRDDGLTMQPQPPANLNIIQHFDEITEQGSFGFATYASAETGKGLIQLAVAATVKAIEHLHGGYAMSTPPPT